ncbi:hypothetical protein LG634_08960 [Streptomyces bambusae]|uniref:FG-GAP repeat domain-containing protein n=1 Tax=Streptomyces bambusae TaxID=1550616 RepID=UPI001CFD4F31|nr:VCBS repeat-containing protein [Streptomyces bambusae]MCB5164957.1 hypothetical protein [Streptomyces bambusae]
MSQGQHRALRRTTLGVATVTALALAVPQAGAADGAVRAGTSAAPGTVVQARGISFIDSGYQWGGVGLDATLPAGTRGSVRTRVVFDKLPPGGWTAERIAPLLTAECYVGLPARTGPCAWRAGEVDTPEQGKLFFDLPEGKAPASGPLNHVAKVSAAAHAAGIGDLRGTAEVRDSSGRLLATGDARLYFRDPQRPASQRAALHAVDKAGVMWRYETTGAEASQLKHRVRVGPGWQVYDTVTALSSFTADGRGDAVARDKAGVLWWYGGSGSTVEPFKPRVKIGPGWQAYNSIEGVGDVTGDRIEDLVARDRAGDLWLFRGTGKPKAPFKARVKAGSGWDRYTQLAGFASRTPSGPTHGLLARDKAGVLWTYEAKPSSSATKPFATRVKVGGGWNEIESIHGVGYSNGDTFEDALVLEKRLGGRTMVAFPGHPAKLGSDESAPRKEATVGHGWNIYTLVF